MMHIIEVENLGKKYFIKQQNSRDYKTFRETLANGLGGLIQYARHPFQGFSKSESTEGFWALKDINFKVNAGDRIGIIGPNGAGKSTLLKIFSRITLPTTGRVQIRGKVSSLLEVGTGFHPELTGKENIMLNGTILGMTRSDILDRFDQIVSFAEIDKFLDTPVKRYSSGMYLKLAFSVAAHLDPDILIVDEVLAVGDVAFQKKCLSRMKEIKEENKTVLFVSHNMGAVSDLCGKVIHIDNGRIVNFGAPRKVIQEYLSNSVSKRYVDLSANFKGRTGNGPMKVLEAELLDENGNQITKYGFRDPIVVRCTIGGHSSESECIMAVSIRDMNGHLILHINNTDSNAKVLLKKGPQQVFVTIPPNVLNNGKYTVTIWLGDALNILNDRVGDILSFEIDNSSAGSHRCMAPVLTQGDWKVSDVHD